MWILKWLVFSIDKIYPSKCYNHMLLFNRFSLDSLATRRNILNIKFHYNMLLYKLHNNRDFPMTVAPQLSISSIAVEQMFDINHRQL